MGTALFQRHLWQHLNNSAPQSHRSSNEWLLMWNEMNRKGLERTVTSMTAEL